ncbi:MAG: TIGR03067 domain-containing protein [Opitutaceae bacterium]
MGRSATPLEGLWQMTRAEFAGESAPEMIITKTMLELSREHYAIRFDGDVMDEGMFSLKSSPANPTLVFTGRRGTNAGQTIPAIYQCVGDRLRICFGFGGEAPTTFATVAGSQLYLALYRRVVR